MTPHDILLELRKREPVRLADLPQTTGIYALWDHGRQIRYIGSTSLNGFRKRLFEKHKSGNEGQSHKFTQAYCTGRMWRYKKTFHGPAFAYLHNQYDADAAKKLRNKFIERYCSATYVEIPAPEAGVYRTYLEGLEHEVQRLAPVEMRRWESKLFREESEPADLVDALIQDGHCLNEEAVERQRALYDLHMKDR